MPILNQIRNLDEMDHFLERDQVPKLNKDHINHLNSPITPKDIEAISKNFPKKSTVPDGFSAELYQTFKEELLFKLFCKIESKGTLSCSFKEATITFIPKPHKDLTKKENVRQISLMKIYAKILIHYSESQRIRTHQKNHSL